MAEIIHEHFNPVQCDGRSYTARTVGTRRDDGTWEGWIEFMPLDASAAPLATERETTQPNREALAYWAQGLEPVYFEGAFDRAIRAARFS
jgi:hypothetical protein